MYDIDKITNKIVANLDDHCNFKTRDENRCFIKTIVTELLKVIAEESEVVLKSALEDGVLIIKDGEITTADRETPILGLQSSEVGVK